MQYLILLLIITMMMFQGAQCGGIDEPEPDDQPAVVAPSHRAVKKVTIKKPQTIVQKARPTVSKKKEKKSKVSVGTPPKSKRVTVKKPQIKVQKVRPTVSKKKKKSKVSV
ncbi:MAG: hypothetical protein BWK78_04155, partial [Thiotrichaceae bacterium IS1]